MCIKKQEKSYIVELDDERGRGWASGCDMIKRKVKGFDGV
jgi:NOL1/NOP2/fmu family ribosome biogenesis protein